MQSEFGVGRVWSSCQGKDEGRHEACTYGAGWVVGIGWRDWAGTRPAPTVRGGWMGLVGGTGQAQGLPLRCGVGGWDWLAGLGRHKACPYGAGWVDGRVGWDWAGTRPAPTARCGWMGLVGGTRAGTRPAPTVRGGWMGVLGGTGQARGLPLRCGVGGWDWVAGRGQARGLHLRARLGGHYGGWRTVSGTEWDGGEGWFWRGALRGRSPCTREAACGRPPKCTWK